MSDVERRYNSNTLSTDDLAAITELLHSHIQILYRCKQGFAILFITRHGIFLVQDRNVDRLSFITNSTHEWISIDLSRIIIASMRERASSVFSIKVARSMVSAACCARRASFSALSCSMVRISSSTRASNAARLRPSLSFSLIRYPRYTIFSHLEYRATAYEGQQHSN